MFKLYADYSSINRMYVLKYDLNYSNSIEFCTAKYINYESERNIHDA